MKAAAEYGADKSFFLIRIWRFLPMPLRAILSGLFVFAVLSNVSSALMMLNLQSTPSIPWSVPVVMCYLWIAIGVAALFFWVAHLNHVNGFARFPSLFVMGNPMKD